MKTYIRLVSALAALAVLCGCASCKTDSDDDSASAFVVWEPVADAVSYSIGMVTGGKSKAVVSEYRSAGSKTYYTWGDLTDGTEYTFSIYATYADGTNNRTDGITRTVSAHTGGPCMRVMGYFLDSSHTVSEQNLHLAVTTDGLHWQSLNGNEPVFTLSTIGGNRVRDPYIVKKSDGSYLMIATDWTLYDADASDLGYHRLYDGTTSEIASWNYTTSSYWDVNTSCLIFADSDDLITWSNERQIQMVSDDDKQAFYDANANYQFCWAPEIIHNDGDVIFTDPETGDSYCYGVIWSGQGETNGTTSKSYNAKKNAYETTTGRSTSYRRTFVNFTNDFETFSAPQVYFEPTPDAANPNSNIDASVVKGYGSKYYIFFKDECSGYYGMGENYSKSLLPNSFNTNCIYGRGYNSTQVQEAAGGTYNQGEGMFCFQPYSGVNRWFCVLDAHDAGEDKVFATFETSDFMVWKENDDTSWPDGDIRHGASVEVTQDELLSLIETFGF